MKTALLAAIEKQLARAKQPQTIMDLGSGFGTMLIPLAKKYPQHHFIGYEWGFVPFFISRLRAACVKNVTLHRRDMFTADIKKADVVILFLIPFLMDRMEQKCRAEAVAGTVVYTNRFKFPTLKPARVINKQTFHCIYVYHF